jgi:AcrR family transcriptional regulator
VVGAETSVGTVGPTGTAAGRETRRRILDAVLVTLRTEGVAGTSARTVARAGGFNQALVFYHYGSVAGALLAALDDLTERRLPAYRAALDPAAPADVVAAAVAALVAEDLRAGHLAAVAALVDGSERSPALKEGITPRLVPWLRLAEEAAVRLAPGRPSADVAVAAVAAALGAGLLARMGDGPGPEALAAMVTRLVTGPPG